MEALLRESTAEHKIGLILPVTAADMHAPPFARIVEELRGADYIDQICVVLGLADESDCDEARRKISSLGSGAALLWTESPAVRAIYDDLMGAGFIRETAGKGLAVWTAFGYLLADRDLGSFVLHDCDIVDYDRTLLARLCLPMAHPNLDFEFAKAFYARSSDRMYGRVARLLVSPLLQSLVSILGRDPFLLFLQSFRYPLSGEFAIRATLARSNRIPSDWGLEIGTLAEVFRNTSPKRVCQVDLCVPYDHKHQDLSPGRPDTGLMRMATDILGTVFRTLASRGTVIDAGRVATLRTAYLRCAQDVVRQYHADAIANGLSYDRHAEEQAVEAFGERIAAAGAAFRENPAGAAAIPNWARVLTAFPDLPSRLRETAFGQ